MRILAIFCVSMAAAVFFSFYLLPLSVVLPAAIVCASLAFGLFFIRRRNNTVLQVFLCLLGAAVGFGVFHLHWNATLRYSEQWDGTEQSFSARLMEEPSKQEHYVRLHVQRTEKPKLDIMLYDYGEEQTGLRPGDVLLVTAKLRRADLRYGERNNNYVSRDIYLTGTVRTVSPTGSSRQSIHTVAANCSSFLSEFISGFFSEDTGVFMQALMLGDKTDFYQDLPLYARMRGAGFMHIVAVSGMHIAFLVGVIQLLLGARPASSGIGLILVWFFVFMTGASPSAVRAGIMQSFLLMAPIFRRENDGITSLAAALAMILLHNPFSCGSISLQLSFSAMAGIILLAEPLTRFITETLRLRKQGIGSSVVSVISASLAVLGFSAPISVIYFGSLALFSPITNLLGLWAVSLCFCGGWISCLFGMLLPKLGAVLAFFPELLARYLIALAGLVCRLPHHMISMQRTEMKLWMLLCYVLVLLAWKGRSSGRLRLMTPLLLGTGTLILSLWSTGLRYRSADAVVAAADVGQGACVCLLSGETTVMFDCGGERTAENAGETAAAWLESAGRDSVNVLILSHLHEDHANGVPLLLELVPVETIVLSPDAAADENMLPAIIEAAEEHGTELVLLREDMELSCGKLTVSLFAPPDDASENERCIISLASVGEYDMLYTGDSPKKAEILLTEQHALPDTELLIVGHHGSKTSTDKAFLAAVKPEYAIISVGRNNSYGHPARETLVNLQAAGCSVYRTDQNGTVEIRVRREK